MVTQNKGRILVCKRYAVLLTGVMILSFGLFNIHSQSKITEGGILGLTLFLKHWFHISPGISEFVLDLLCYLTGLRILGKSFLKNALISSAGYALFYSLWEFTGPFLPNLGHRPLFAAVVGGLFVGVGVGLVVRAGGATGGDDALALILSPQNTADAFKSLPVYRCCGSALISHLHSAGKNRLFTGDCDHFFHFDRENPGSGEIPAYLLHTFAIRE